ncbi:mitochondrial sodium/calcium exchanger protein-like [Patiria miniata]|uniref:Sodium/calcium exchanger membrane region domain-containing protein n=1 Tax=Patiria miniata TaxID=46514 RepID=A0A913YXQ7_PATMI|nr:mitochondrial sodium/calcium exchanger protein-like [Patiria miniata]
MDNRRPSCMHLMSAFVAVIAVFSEFCSRVAAESVKGDGQQTNQENEASKNDTCIFYHELGSDKQCDFIQKTEDCKPENGFINYLEFTYCAFSPNLQPLALVILFVWLTFLFVCLGVTAKNFFCPTLLTISKTLKLSDNVAGVTFLAFGNGAPDVFSAIAAITHAKDGDAGLAIGALFGAAVFITTFVAGTVSALKPFEVAQIPFLRDAIFVVGVAYWTFYILYTGQILTEEAIGFILLYVFYVCVVLISRKFERPVTVTTPVVDGEGSYARLEDGLSAESQDVTSNIDKPTENPQNDKPHPASKVDEKPTECTDTDNKAETGETNQDVPKDVQAENVPEKEVMEEILKPSADRKGPPKPAETCSDELEARTTDNQQRATKRTNFGTMDLGEKQVEVQDNNVTHSTEMVAAKTEEFTGGNSEEEPLLPRTKKPGSLGYQLRALFRDINPIDVEGWKNKGYIMRIFEIYKSPIQLLLQISVPLVLHDKCSWNRLLNCIQLLIGPVWCVLITNIYGTVISGEFYLWHLVLCFGAVLAILALLTSKPSQPPVYYIAFAFLGFVISVCWIYAIANEIVNLLRMYGEVFDLSDAILGLTFLAWGNCIGDLVADTAMAQQGAPKMAISACFGGPVFNMLIGIGVATTIATAENGGIFKLKTDTLQFVLAAGLGISLFTSMFFMIAARFRATKVYSVLLYIFYAVFMTIAILTESKVIKW